MPSFDPDAYGPTVAALLRPARLPALDAGHPAEAVRPQLGQLAARPEQMFAAPVVDVDLMQACLAGLWLYHDFLDQSHTVSQSIDTREGSFWHAIMHRREGDFGNSKYWFHRVGSHPLFEPLGAEARQLPGADLVAEWPLWDARGRWDPCAGVDLQQRAVRQAGAIADYCRLVQQLEWRLLFDFCYRGATGTKPG